MKASRVADILADPNWESTDIDSPTTSITVRFEGFATPSLIRTILDTRDDQVVLAQFAPMWPNTAAAVAITRKRVLKGQTEL